MSLSKYQVISGLDGKIKDIKGLKIILLAIVIRDVKEAAINFLNKQEAHGGDQGIRFNYFECAKTRLRKIQFEPKNLNTENLTAQKMVADIVAELNTEFDEAKADIDESGSKMSCISDMIEIWVFFSGVAKKSIDHIKVLEDKEIKYPDLAIGRSYHSKIQIDFNNNEWVYNVCNDAKTEVKKQVVVDGVVNPKMIGHAYKINSVLSMVAVMAQKDCVDKRFVDEYSEVSTFVKKAKAIASILGGDWQDYIIFVGSIDGTVNEMERRKIDNNSQKQTIERMSVRDLRATALEINEIIKLFLAKPIYH